MPTPLIRRRCRLRFYASDRPEPPHVRIAKDGKSAKVWLGNLSLEYNRGYGEHEMRALMRIVAEHRETGSERGMASSQFETEEMRPVAVRRDGAFVSAALAHGREIRTPLWWYPFLQTAAPAARAETELMFEGVWWPALDEGISVKSMLLGWNSPGAVEPAQAAE